MSDTLLLCGPKGSARPARIDALVREHWGRALLLTPTHAYAARRREKLILKGGGTGAWGNPVLPFRDFALQLLLHEGRAVRPVDTFEQRLLVQQALESPGAAAELAGLAASPDNPGLVSHLLRVIVALKQAAIEPEDFRIRAAREMPSPFDPLVAETYLAYQEALRQSNRYDVPGLYWEAELLCSSGLPAFLQPVDALLLDSFDDLTPSEFRLIEAAQHHVEQLVFGLNYDHRPDRQDLFALSARTLASVVERFGPSVEHFESPAPDSLAAHGAAKLFWRDRPGAAVGLAPNLKVLPCSDPAHEIETIGRAVKGLIVEHDVPPGEIAVVFRDLGEVAATVRTVFSGFSVPLHLHHRPQAAGSAIGSFLRRFLEAASAWSRETVLDVALSPWAHTGALPPEYARAAPALARNAHIISGFEEWTQCLERLGQRMEQGGEGIKPLLKRFPKARQATDALRERVTWLKGLADSLPAQCTQGRFAEALDAVLDALGIEQALEACGNRAVAEEERSALAAIRGVLNTLSDTDPGGTCTRATLLTRFEEGLQAAQYTWPGNRHGVSCYDAASVRNLAFDHVFFGGLVEGATPMPPAINAVYADEDLARLQRAGIPLEGRREHGERERLLFHHVLTVARRSLTLTWSVTRPDGKPTTRSPFLTELLELFEEDMQIEAAMPVSDSFLPQPEQAASVCDLRNVAFHGASALQQTFPEHCESLHHSITTERRRRDESPFDAHDGVLAAAPLPDILAARFREDYCYSVSQLETYGDCPFRFFASRVLRVEETESPEVEFDPMVRGTILHTALEQFHRHFAGRTVAELPAEEAESTMHGCVADAFERHGWRSATAPPGLLAVEQTRMTETLLRYLEIERSREDAGWKPSHFEVSFGDAHGRSEDPLSTLEPFHLETSEGPVCLAGRIDRVDRMGNTARILDYKSGGLPSARDIMSGRSLQLTLYAWALGRHVVPENACIDALFAQPGKEKQLSAMHGRGRNAEEREHNALAQVTDAVRGMRTGRFPPTPAKEACRYCPYSSACRYEQARTERKLAAAKANDLETKDGGQST